MTYRQNLLTVKYSDGRADGSHTAVQTNLVDHENSTNYLDQGFNFYTGGARNIQEEANQLPELLAPLSKHETNLHNTGEASRHVVTSRLAAGNMESPQDLAIKNVLLSTHNLPNDINSTERHQIVPKTKSKVNHAREKWGRIDFSDEEAVKFRAGLNVQIIELRKNYAAANAVVNFPDKVPNEALSYVRPRFGPEWETFDGAKHLDYEAKQQLEQRRGRLQQLKDQYKKKDEAKQTNQWVFDDHSHLRNDDDPDHATKGEAQAQAVMPNAYMSSMGGQTGIDPLTGGSQVAVGTDGVSSTGFSGERSDALKMLYASAIPNKEVSTAPVPTTAPTVFGGKRAGYAGRAGAEGAGANEFGNVKANVNDILKGTQPAAIASTTTISTSRFGKTIYETTGKRRTTINMPAVTPFFQTTLHEFDPVPVVNPDHTKRWEEIPIRPAPHGATPAEKKSVTIATPGSPAGAASVKQQLGTPQTTSMTSPGSGPTSSPSTTSKPQPSPISNPVTNSSIVI